MNSPGGGLNIIAGGMYVYVYGYSYIYLHIICIVAYYIGVYKNCIL